MNMHSAKHVAAAEHAQIVHHFVVSYLRTMDGFIPCSCRVGSARHDGEPVLGGDLSDFFPEEFQLLESIGRVEWMLVPTSSWA